MIPERIVAAALLAPMAVPVGCLLYFRTNMSFGILFFIFAIVSTYLGTLLLGMPLYGALRYLGILNLLSLAVAGILSGMIVFAFVLHMFPKVMGPALVYDYGDLIWGGASGLVTALVFGLIAGVGITSNSRLDV